MKIQEVWRRWWNEHRILVILVGLGLALVLAVVIFLVLSGGRDGIEDRVRRLSAQVRVGSSGTIGPSVSTPTGGAPTPSHPRTGRNRPRPKRHSLIWQAVRLPSPVRMASS